MDEEKDRVSRMKRFLDEYESVIRKAEKVKVVFNCAGPEIKINFEEITVHAREVAV